MLENDRHPQLPFTELLHSALKASEENGRFSAVNFFTRWLREWGRFYFFLFRKNRRVTDIQVAELVSLLRVHGYFDDRQDQEASDSKLGNKAELHFLSKDDFENTLNAIVSTFAHDDPNERYRIIAERYSELLRSVLVIENYFGSTAIYTPPLFRVCLGRLCAEAGYIHSCGKGVFLRNVYKATREGLFRELTTHLKDSLEDGRKLFFTVYSHEDFTDWDRSQRQALRDGLDDVKIRLSKMHIMESDIQKADVPLAEMVKEMRTKFADRLVFPDPGDYRASHRKALEDPNLDRSRSLWLIVDSDLGPTLRLRGDRRFYILYDQHYINESPFIECDENKPAWIDHTTIPHTLMGAMINVTRPYWIRDEMTIADPFMGSGTTYHETLKFGSTVRCVGGDDNPLCKLVIEDNLRYLSGNKDELTQISNEVGSLADYFRLAKSPKKARSTLEQAIEDKYEVALNIFEKLDLDGQEFHFTEEVTRLLSNTSPAVRLIFYVMLRAHRRNTAALNLRAKPWHLLMSDEAADLSEQLEEIAKQRHYEEAGESDKAINIYLGTHSKACSVGSGYMRMILSSNRVHQQICSQDALLLLQQLTGQCDLIVTDPPYGFNTHDDSAKLAQLYAKGIEAMICALRAEGQLIIALPDWSYTGRHLPKYARPDFITHQVLVCARKSRREVVQAGSQMSNEARFVMPSYYWESEKALRRAILHFRFRPAPGESFQREIWQTAELN